MTTLKENIEAWKNEYNDGDIVHKYIMHTILLMEHFKIEQIKEWVEKQPEITREDYLKALDNK